MILWLRGYGIYYLEHQRKLDRCVYPVLKLRCQTLGEISKINKTLNTTAISLAALKTGKVITSIIPFLGQAVAFADGCADILRASMRAAALYQETLIQAERLSQGRLLKCGYPVRGLKKLDLIRKDTIASRVAKVPGLLEWSTGAAHTEIHVKLLFGGFESYGYCSGAQSLYGAQPRLQMFHEKAGRYW